MFRIIILVVLLFQRGFILECVYAKEHSYYKIMSYNILGDKNIKYGQYDLLPIEVIDWNFRKHRINEKIISEKPDILLLQEIDNNSYNFFYQELKKFGYSGKHFFDLGTFYKMDKFKLKSQVNFKYSIGKGTLELILQNKLHQFVRVLNIHLKWDNKPRETHIGCRQILELNTFLNDRISTRKSHLTIIGGDFNLKPNDPCLHIISDKYLDSHQDMIHPTFYGYQRNGEATRIDFIFFSKGWLAASKNQFLLAETLPNLNEPSDHIPIITTLTPDTSENF